MQPVNSSNRLVYLDLLRGFFLFAVLIDHLQRRPGLFELITGGGTQWASAAEGFFFLSGMLLGIVRGRQMETKGVTPTLRKTLNRALTLYLVSVGLTITFSIWAVLIGGQVGMDDPAPYAHLTWSILSDALTFRTTYGWTNFLSFYAVFLAASPLALLLLRRNLWYVVLFISGAVYLLRGENPYMAWQLLFFVGSVAGYHFSWLREKLNSLPRNVQRYGFATLCVASLMTYSLSQIYTSTEVREELTEHIIPSVQAASITNSLGNHLETSVTNSLAAYDSSGHRHFDRQVMASGRIAAFALWFSTLLGLFKLFEGQITRYLGWLWLSFGRYPLLTFSLHGFLAYWVDYQWPHPHGSVAFNALTNVVAVLLLYGAVHASLALHQRLAALRVVGLKSHANPLGARSLR